MNTTLSLSISLLCLINTVSCAIHHSKQAMLGGASHTPGAHATFVTEEDSGLQIGGIISLSEPDHYAVLLERARQRYKCSKMHHAQLDFYTDHWLIVAFPISRITLICEHETPASEHSPRRSSGLATPAPRGRAMVRP